MAKKQQDGSGHSADQIDRRSFLVGLGASTAAVAVEGAQAGTASPAVQATSWDFEADVVIVGSGAASGVAASKALDSGAKVVVVEKSPAWGGTTAKSGGWYWIPNNSLMRKAGLEDPREDAIRYMARLAYPTKYMAGGPTLGLSQLEYNLLSTFYERGSEAVDDLARMGAVESQFVGGDIPTTYDYGAAFLENKAPVGRGLMPKGAPGWGGTFLTRALRDFITRKGGKILMGHRASELVLNNRREVVGLRVRKGKETLAIRARRGVIFGSGGFTHNVEYRRTFLRGPVFGGCAVPTNEGDFIPMALDAGADLGNMTNAFWGQCVLEEALKAPSFGNTLFLIPGRSMFMVNRLGKRVVDEHMVYNERTQAHFVWDANRYEFINRVLIMIFDEATRAESPDWYPIPAAGASPSYLLKGESFESLASAIDTRLQELAPQLGAIRLDHHFVANLNETAERFARFAKAGKDDDFGRDSNYAGRLLSTGGLVADVVFGDKKSESASPPPKADTPKTFRAASREELDPETPNRAMRALRNSGPYYAVLLGGGTLDTKGGPLINANAQVLDKNGQVISGLYGAGNCIASPVAAAYYGPGGTIGPAVTFGYIAGEHAAHSAVKET